MKRITQIAGWLGHHANQVIITLAIVLLQPFASVHAETNTHIDTVGIIVQEASMKEPMALVTAPTLDTLETIKPTPEVAYNDYAAGNCTWYAYEARLRMDRPISGNWGNAATWAIRAQSQGYPVDRNPEIGAVFQDNIGATGLGHVAIVKQINEDGTILISEMNARGLGVISDRIITNPGSYNYIH